MARTLTWLILSMALLESGTVSTADATLAETPAPSVSGPGGTGTIAIVQPNAPGILEVETSFTSGDFLDIAFTVEPTPIQDPLSPVYGLTEVISNHTGATWRGFRYTLISGPPGTQFGSADDASFHFPGANSNAGAPPITSFTFFGGSVESGDSFSPFVGLFVFEPGEIVFRETPLLAIPSSLLLLAAGILGSCGRCIRRKSPHMRGRGPSAA